MNGDHLVPQGRLSQQSIEDAEMCRLRFLAVGREVEPDLADILCLIQQPDEVADFEGTGRSGPQRMETERDSDSAVATKRDASSLYRLGSSVAATITVSGASSSVRGGFGKRSR